MYPDVAILVTVLFFQCCNVAVVGGDRNRLAVIMLDGFRHDYAERLGDGDIPALRGFMSTGVRSEYVQTIFPSTSLASWTTMVTGETGDNRRYTSCES